MLYFSRSLLNNSSKMPVDLKLPWFAYLTVVIFSKCKGSA